MIGRLNDCCVRCTGCNRRVCLDQDEMCEHASPLCVDQCCPAEHEIGGEAA